MSTSPDPSDNDRYQSEPVPGPKITLPGTRSFDQLAFNRLAAAIAIDRHGFLNETLLSEQIPKTTSDATDILFGLMTGSCDPVIAFQAGSHLLNTPDIPYPDKQKLLDDVLQVVPADSAIGRQCQLIRRLLLSERGGEVHHYPPPVSNSQTENGSHHSLTQRPTEDLIEILSTAAEDERMDVASALAPRLHTLDPGELLSLNQAAVDFPAVRDLLKQLAFENLKRLVSVRVIAYNVDNPFDIIVRRGSSKEWSLPGGKLDTVNLPAELKSADRTMRMESPFEALLREGADEVSKKLFRHLHELKGRLSPLTVLVTPKSKFLKEKWALLENPTDGLKEDSDKKWIIPHPWTQVFLLPVEGTFKSREKEGRAVSVLNTESQNNLRDLRPAHSEVVWKYRQQVKEGRKVSPFTVYSKQEH